LAGRTDIIGAIQTPAAAFPNVAKEKNSAERKHGDGRRKTTQRPALAGRITKGGDEMTKQLIAFRRAERSRK